MYNIFMATVKIAAYATQIKFRIEYSLSESSLRLSITDNQSLKCLHRCNGTKNTTICPWRVKNCISCNSISGKWAVCTSSTSHSFGSNIMCVISTCPVQLIGPFDWSQWPLFFKKLNCLLVCFRSLVSLNEWNCNWFF